MALGRRDSRKLGRMESDGLGASDDLLAGGIGLSKNVKARSREPKKGEYGHVKSVDASVLQKCTEKKATMT